MQNAMWKWCLDIANAKPTKNHGHGTLTIEKNKRRFSQQCQSPRVKFDDTHRGGERKH